MRIRRPTHLKDDLVVAFLTALVIAIVMAI
jgi:hypothetical protein